ncbi:MAG: zinc ribbon domain-containing protein [Ktedonobacterales bacterium]
MALIKCPECGEQVSTSAAACPHCGKQIAKKPKSAVASLFQLVLGILLVWWSIGWLMHMGH